MQTLAQEFNRKIAAILTEDQKTHIKEYKETLAQWPAGRRQQPRNTLFRAKRYGLNHPALVSKTLTPGKTLVELQEEREHPEGKN